MSRGLKIYSIDIKIVFEIYYNNLKYIGTYIRLAEERKSISPRPFFFIPTPPPPPPPRREILDPLINGRFFHVVKLIMSLSNTTLDVFIVTLHAANVGIHRPCSYQVTERMKYNFVLHPSPSMYHKATNAAVCGQWTIKHNCQNDSTLIIFTVWDIVHRNYVTPQNIPRLTNRGKYCQFIFLQLIFVLFIRYPHRVS